MGLRRIGRRFRRAFRRVKDFGKKAFNAVTKPLKVAQDVIGRVTKVLEKLPGGKLIAGFANKFLQNPLSLLNMATLGPVGALINLAKDPKSLVGIVASVAGSGGGQSPQGLNNILHMAARRHADLLFRR